MQKYKHNKNLKLKNENYVNFNEVPLFIWEQSTNIFSLVYMYQEM